ncbi:MAG: phosphomannomutase [Bacteroidota bacterium]|jgi:phosphoglucomutase
MNKSTSLEIKYVFNKYYNNMSALTFDLASLGESIKNKVTSWLNGSYDSNTKEVITNWIKEGNADAITEAFYKDLEFGTGGLRGIMGVGSNRINRYTIGTATQGLANYLIKTYPNQAISVAIAHDSRNDSDTFAKVTADVFSANGIKVYFFSALRPTPELSFAIRHFGCQSGVVLTASHNPKEYNGYKAYWNDGAQMIAPHDVNVITEVNAIQSISEVKFTANPDLIHYIGEEVDNAYLNKIVELSISKEAIKRQKDLKIVFTPIHGTGITVVPKVLELFGFENVTIVEEQSNPDGNFPTVVYPNPEEAEALSIAIKKAQEIDADLVLATDPDADRVGIAIKNDKNEFQLLNGNQTGALLIYYLVNAWKEANKITGKQYVVKTIVTTGLIAKIAEKFEVKCYDTLTGFKFIAALIKELEGKETFIGGGEESYGYLIGDSVRDKDAVASSAFIAEMVAWAKDQNKSLYDLLLDMYVEFGFFKEKLISITKKGKSGAEEIKAMMKELRENAPSTIAGSQLVTIADYENGIEHDMVNKTQKPLTLPKSDVLQFITADGSIISARPSGTEPKIKFYFSVNLPLTSKNEYVQVSKALDEKINAAVADLRLN